MDALQLLLLAVIVYVGGGVLSLCVSCKELLAIRISGASAIGGGVVGVFAAASVLLDGTVHLHALAGPFPFATFSVRMDGLAAFMVLVISLLVSVVGLYSLSYVREYIGRGAGVMGFYLNLFVAAMVGLMVMDNAFYFIILFEMMSLASWFLVIADQDDEAVSAGLLYFFMAHAGSVLIMMAFFLMARESGSVDFSNFRATKLSPAMASTVFLLAFFGFGAKAGILPLHSWLPRAHPAAPSHASALMSGVMVKVGVFGIIKVGIDLLGATQTWWGVTVLAFGAVSAVLGVLYALMEHDIKRLLAWHTVENVGIILMGVGVSMIGMAQGMPVLAALGMLGALYHVLNHAVFKGLLFLGAGSVIWRVHTRDMEAMGGLGKRMPITGVVFLVGCMAISALPPLNGFVSEWYTYQALFSMSLKDSSLLLRMSGPIAMVMLAITGALAAMCFVKVYGISFCGAPRSEQASHAREVPAPMWLAKALLALLCVALGVGASEVVPVISRVAASLTQANDFVANQGVLLVPQHADQAMLSPSLSFILLVAWPLLPFIVYVAVRGAQPAFRRRGEPWACGYAWEPRMAWSCGSVVQPLRVMFAPLFRWRTQLDPSARLASGLARTRHLASIVEPFWDQYLILPVAHAVQRLSGSIQRLQGGDFRLYCLYVVIALLILLLVTVV